MIARLGWLALGVVFGALGGWVTSRRVDTGTPPPVLAAATRLPLEATVPPPSRTAVPDATTPDADPAPEVSAPDAEPLAAVAEEPDPAPAAEPVDSVDDEPGAHESTTSARPTPSPRPRSDRPGRHAWVSPEDEAPGSTPA